MYPRSGIYRNSELIRIIGLLDIYAPKKLLRENLAFKNAWWYYAAMIIDPILRFNWIFYVIVPHQLQTSALLSFFVAFSEVCRRGIWTVFRVENEHCTNVERFRASRDVPLPYKFKQPETIAEAGSLLAPVGEEQEMDEAHLEEQRRQGIRTDVEGLSHIPTHTSGYDVHRTHTAQSAGGSTIRRRRKLEQSPLIRRMGSILHMAHAQDFERKKRPEAGEAVGRSSDSEGDDEDDDNSDDIDQEVAEAERVVDEEMARVDGADERGRDGKKGEEGREIGGDGKTGRDGDGEEMGKESSAEEAHWEFRKRNADGGEMSSGMQSPKVHSPPK